MHKVIERLRWFSAFVVVFGHARSLTFLPLKEVSNQSVFIKVFYFLTGYGHQAVIVFFMISGFLVAKPLIKKKS